MGVGREERRERAEIEIWGGAIGSDAQAASKRKNVDEMLSNAETHRENGCDEKDKYF